MAHRPARPNPGGGGGGFVPLPRAVFDALLTLPLTKREMLALLLVARLTYGCRGSAQARLRQADLRAVGIGPGHAKEVLDGLVGRGLLVREVEGYRLGALEPRAEAGYPARTERLELLVARHLGGTFPKEEGALTASATAAFPLREGSSSQIGKPSVAPDWRFDRSQGQFVRGGNTDDRQG